MSNLARKDLKKRPKPHKAKGFLFYKDCCESFRKIPLRVPLGALAASYSVRIWGSTAGSKDRTVRYQEVHGVGLTALTFGLRVLLGFTASVRV